MSNFAKTAGFTIVELVVVIILIGILAATALPRFLSVTDDARLGAAQQTAGAFSESMVSLHAAWIAKAKPANLTIDGVNIEFSNNGWPQPAAAGTPGCMEVWQATFRGAEPIVAYVNGAVPEAWSALGFGATCIFIYQYGEAFTAANQLPIFLYQPRTSDFLLQKYYM